MTLVFLTLVLIRCISLSFAMSFSWANHPWKQNCIRLWGELVSRMPLRSELVTFKVTVDVLNRCTVLDFSRPLLVTHDSYR
jgi:hypothetical protein